MAVNRVPVLKRCRSLGLDPIYLGIDKKSTRELKRANRKVSRVRSAAYVRNRKQNSSTVFWRNLSTTTTRRLTECRVQTGANLMTILESRLDNVVFRMGLARTRQEATSDR